MFLQFRPDPKITKGLKPVFHIPLKSLRNVTKVEDHSEPSQISKIELFAKIAVNYFPKKLHLRCLIGF